MSFKIFKLEKKHFKILLPFLFLVVLAIFGFSYKFLKAEVGATAEIAWPPEAQAQKNSYVGKFIFGPEIFADITEKVGPAVVNIDWEKKIRRKVFDPFSDFDFGFGFEPQKEFKKFFTDQVIPLKGAGSGFIINKDGYILTNYHVVKEAEKEKINITLKDGRKFSGKIVGTDSTLDLAIVKINAHNLPVALMGDSDKTRPGEFVVAIGNPYQFQNTVTVGIISATGRELEVIDKHNLIQTDAAINPGNSGGPLINLKGEVIGINVAIAAPAQGIGFAIPINAAKKVLKELLSRGKVSRTWLGIYMRDVDQAIADYLDLPLAQGVIIVDVAPDSPAEKAGLKKYDVILEVDKKKIKSAQELSDLIRSKKINEKVMLYIYRDGQKALVAAALGEAP